MSVRTAFTRLALRALKWSGLPLQDPGLSAFFGPAPTASGAEVNEYTALNVSAVFAAVRLLAESMACCDLPLFTVDADDGDEHPDVQHEAHRLISDAPNPEMTPFSFRSTLMAHCCTWGNGFAEIQRKKSGRPHAIWPITPNRVRPRRVISTREIVYDIFPNAGSEYALQALPIQGEQMVTIPARDMIHIPGLGFDGLMGYSVITIAREAIGMALATERYGNAFFGNGSRPSGVLTHPGKMSKDAKVNLRESWERTHGGLNGAQRTALLEEGVKWEAIGIPPEDAQFLGTRRFTIYEFARWFNVPPHMLRDLERATFSNIEHQGIDFVNYSLQPWMMREAQEYRRKLLLDGERNSRKFEHNTERLTRGDQQTRVNTIKVAEEAGLLNPNEGRRMLGLNHRADPEANEYRRPANIVPDDTPAPADSFNPEPSAKDNSKDPDAADAKKAKEKKAAKKKAREQKQLTLVTAHRGIVSEALERMTAVEATAIRRAARDPRKFLPTVDDFYGRFEAMLRAALSPAMRMQAALEGTDAAQADRRAGELACNHISQSRRELLTAAECPADKLESTIDALCKRWETDRARTAAEIVLQDRSAAHAA